MSKAEINQIVKIIKGDDELLFDVKCLIKAKELADHLINNFDVEFGQLSSRNVIGEMKQFMKDESHDTATK